MKNIFHRAVIFLVVVSMITVMTPSLSYAADDAATIKYSVDAGDELDFKRKDFNDVCDDVTLEQLDYIKFTSLPSESKGTLFFKYDTNDEEEVGKTEKYYYDDEDQSISDLTFVPDKKYDGTITISYKGYNDENETYSGEIRITVSGDDEDEDVIEYTADENEEVDFRGKDFFEVCDNVNDEDLDYVKFTLPASSKGILYLAYDTDDEEKVTASGKYKYDDDPDISDITFVPKKNYNGTVTITYKGYDVDGESFSGEVKIVVGDSNDEEELADDITYSGTVNSSIFFKAADFNKVCDDLMDNELDYVRFTLPTATYGTLNYGYSAGSIVNPSTQYFYQTGETPNLAYVSFVPARSGTVTIDYSGYDTDGLSFSGKVKLTVTESTAQPPTNTTGQTPTNTTLVSSKYFKDVDQSYSWAVPYIDGLYESGVVTGTASGSVKYYSPASSVTRGEFMLILYKALNLKTTSVTTGFKDVPKSSIYYDAIMTSKALGIAQGADNTFNPNTAITREDAMVFILRAVNITRKTIPSADVSSLSVYKDYSSISDYSKTAVAALVKAGIITGSDDNMIHPQGKLTRAQVAAIIYRIK